MSKGGFGPFDTRSRGRYSFVNRVIPIQAKQKGGLDMIRTLTVPEDAVRELHEQVASNRIRTCFLWSGGSLIYRYEKEPNAAAELHKVNSVTKSVLSLLVGIAVDEGRIGPLDAPISDYLPRVPEDKASIAVEHLLTMSPGFDWPEMGAWHGYPKAMVNSPDWVRFVLGREMTEAPGRRMVYNSGASQLLSAVLQRAVGMPTAAYARKRLFEPLGIDRFVWPSDPHGIGIGGFGLRLRGEDLVRIGRLVLRKGSWEGKLGRAADRLRTMDRGIDAHSASYVRSPRLLRLSLVDAGRRRGGPLRAALLLRDGLRRPVHSGRSRGGPRRDVHERAVQEDRGSAPDLQGDDMESPRINPPPSSWRCLQCR